MLNRIGSKFGYNSVENKKADGTPKGEKKHATKPNDNSTKTA